jgi:hypothetical protein
VSEPPGKIRDSLKYNNWNLLLLVPLVTLITPLVNFDGPRLLGMPFFYWSQFAFVIVGVLCVWIVYVKTKDEPVGRGPDRLSVDDLDARDAK